MLLIAKFHIIIILFIQDIHKVPNFFLLLFSNTVTPILLQKPILSAHSKIDNTKVLKTDGSLMQVESFAECSKGSILQYF